MLRNDGRILPSSSISTAQYLMRHTVYINGVHFERNIVMLGSCITWYPISFPSMLCQPLFHPQSSPMWLRHYTSDLTWQRRSFFWMTIQISKLWSSHSCLLQIAARICPSSFWRTLSKGPPHPWSFLSSLTIWRRLKQPVNGSEDGYQTHCKKESGTSIPQWQVSIERKMLTPCKREMCGVYSAQMLLAWWVQFIPRFTSTYKW